MKKNLIFLIATLLLIQPISTLSKENLFFSNSGHVTLGYEIPSPQESELEYH